MRRSAFLAGVLCFAVLASGALAGTSIIVESKTIPISSVARTVYLDTYIDTDQAGLSTWGYQLVAAITGSSGLTFVGSAVPQQHAASFGTQAGTANVSAGGQQITVGDFPYAPVAAPLNDNDGLISLAFNVPANLSGVFTISLIDLNSGTGTYLQDGGFGMTQIASVPGTLTIPEPASMSLLAIGGIAALWRRRKQSR